MLLLFCVTNSYGMNLDDQRSPAGRVPGWHGSLDCLEQSKTALAVRRASAWMARVSVGHLENSSQSIDDLPRQERIHISQTRRKYIHVCSIVTSIPRTG